MREQLETFRTYSDNWDEEGAPAPSPDAIARAQKVLDWAEAKGLTVTEVDADVLGGIAIFFASKNRRACTVWIACMNTEGDAAVCTTEDRTISHFMFSMEDASATKVLEFLGALDGKARH
jgi:hypothetical protein